MRIAVINECDFYIISMPYVGEISRDSRLNLAVIFTAPRTILMIMSIILMSVSVVFPCAYLVGYNFRSS